MRLISLLIKDISIVLQKLLKYFNGKLFQNYLWTQSKMLHIMLAFLDPFTDTS